MPAMASARRLAASRISGVCEGTLTASFTALRTPRSASSAIARSTAAASPPMTICPGELKLAGTTTWLPAACAQTSATTASSAPSTAAMAPTPAGAASCISWPRRRTRWAPSRSVNAPAATSAVYSPRLWPASTAGCAPWRDCHSRHSATPPANSAGWVYSVRLSISSGPPCDSAHRSTPAPCEASAKVSANLRVQLGQFGQHAQRLGTLTWEDESEGIFGHARRVCENERRSYGWKSPPASVLARMQGMGEGRSMGAVRCAGGFLRTPRGARESACRRLSSAAAPSPR